MPRNETRWTLLAFDTDTGADQFQFPFYPEGKDRVANFFANPVGGRGGREGGREGGRARKEGREGARKGGIAGLKNAS